MRSMSRSTASSASGRAWRSRSASPRPPAAARSTSTARSARRRCCAARASATTGRCATRRSLRLFREIMSACLAQQEPLKVAFLGPEGTFTQTAVLKHFGHSVRALPLAVDRRGVPRGRGRQRRLRRRADRELHRGHGQPHARPLPHLAAEDLRRGGAAHPSAPDGPHEIARGASQRVCSHPQSLAQCRGWLDEHLPGRRAGAGVEQRRRRAPRARRGGHRGDRRRDRRRGLRPARCSPREIEDRADNTTRFLVLGRKLFAPSGEDRTTLLVSVGAHRCARRAVAAARAAREAPASA